MASRMLIKLILMGDAGVTVSCAEVLPLAAAQYVHRSSSTALAASNPAADHVESAVAGCPLSWFVLKRPEYHEPNCCKRARSLGSNSPVCDGGTLKLSVQFIPTVWK